MSTFEWTVAFLAWPKIRLALLSWILLLSFIVNVVCLVTDPSASDEADDNEKAKKKQKTDKRKATTRVTFYCLSCCGFWFCFCSFSLARERCWLSPPLHVHYNRQLRLTCLHLYVHPIQSLWWFSWEATIVQSATCNWLHESVYKQNNCNLPMNHSWSESGGNKDVNALAESVYWLFY